MSFKCLLVFKSELLAFAEADINGETHGEMFDGPLTDITLNGIENAVHIDAPSNPPVVTMKGNISTGDVARLRFVYVYCNKYGSTTQSDTTTISTNLSPVEFMSSQYLEISGPVSGQGITGVDVYFTQNEAQDYAFCGHVDVQDGQSTWVLP